MSASVIGGPRVRLLLAIRGREPPAQAGDLVLEFEDALCTCQGHPLVEQLGQGVDAIDLVAAVSALATG